MENLERLVKELCKLPNETQWVEFKHNNYRAEMIGENISALANSAALYEKNCAYMLWGIDDKTHEIVGTKENFQTLKRGNEELENWLRVHLSRNADFEFHSVPIDGVIVGVLCIQKAVNYPVTFQKFDYIRVGSYTKKLNEYPTIQTQLWDRLRNTGFEERSAKQNLDLQDALRLLDYSIYFDIMGIPLPSDMEGVSYYMLEEGVILKQDDGLYSISNMGAILFAKRLVELPRIFRKAIRVVQYKGKNRLNMLREATFEKGYVACFEGVCKFIETLIPAQEEISIALREKKTEYPLLAIREAVGNALIHQDFSITGTGPTVEIFENRIEITNSGIPLVDVDRIIDTPPKSRNEKLAALMRRLGLCEELGTGWDKIVLECEKFWLPAPKIELYDDSTRVSLYARTPFNSISREDKLRACYHHACIMYTNGEYLTNATLRARFGMETFSSASVSRLIKAAVVEKLIKPLDPTAPPKFMKYVPAWA